MHGLIGWGAARRWGAGVLVLAAAVAAQAVPLQSDERSAMVGGTVTPLFTISSLSAFEGADLSFSFDPTYLHFLGCDLDCPGVGFDAGAAAAGATGTPGHFLLSLAADTPITANNVPLFNLLFEVIARPASGTTEVSFESLDTSPTLLEAMTVTITIPEAPITIPVAGSQWLALTALALLPLGRRFRRRADPSSTGV
jgi:hypothetical protein